MNLVIILIFLNINIIIHASEKTDIVKKLGDREIQVIAPASGVEQDVLEHICDTYPLHFVYPDNLLNSSGCPFHSNTDKFRANHLKKVLNLNNSEAIIWSLRGGYGTARIIDTLFNIPKPDKEKTVIGYSDITVLHLFLSQQWGWKTIHGQMLIDLNSDSKSAESLSQLVDVLTKNVTEYTLHNLKPLNNIYQTPIEGKLTGGNICLLDTSIGTQWQLDAHSRILFMEDVHTQGYEVDRMLNHLKEVGAFDDVKAIIFGEFAAAGDDFVDYALQRFTQNVTIPVFKTDKFGHGVYNFPLIYNAETTIKCTKEALCDMTISVL